jgi:hypothetical protein
MLVGETYCMMEVDGAMSLFVDFLRDFDQTPFDISDRFLGEVTLNLCRNYKNPKVNF